MNTNGPAVGELDALAELIASGNECAWCLGDGYLHDADMKCPRCDGTGKEKANARPA